MQKLPSKKRYTPFFYKGVLAFKESGHTLTHAKQYVCSQKQKGKCRLPEVRIKVSNLERNFSRLAKTFTIPEEAKWPVMKKTLGMILHTHIDEMLDSEDFYEEVFESYEDVMKQDIAEGKIKQFKSDLKGAKEALEKEIYRNPEFVASLLFGVVLTFSKIDMSEVQLGRTLAYLSEKVYLSNNGKIVSIKLNTLGDYLFQYMRKHIPGYTVPYKWFVGERKFKTLDYRSIAKEIRLGRLPDFTIPPLALGATIVPLSKIMFANLPTMTPQKAFEYVQLVHNSPLGRLMMSLTAVSGRKPRKKQEEVL